MTDKQKIKANAILIIERQISAENYKQRGPHSYFIPQTPNQTQHE